jgi:hypothetical protein
MRYKKIGGVRFVKLGRFGGSFWIKRKQKLDLFPEITINPQLALDLERRLRQTVDDLRVSASCADRQDAAYSTPVWGALLAGILIVGAYALSWVVAW